MYDDTKRIAAIETAPIAIEVYRSIRYASPIEVPSVEKNRDMMMDCSWRREVMKRVAGGGESDICAKELTTLLLNDGYSAVFNIMPVLQVGSAWMDDAPKASFALRRAGCLWHADPMMSQRTQAKPPTANMMLNVHRISHSYWLCRFYAVH